MIRVMADGPRDVCSRNKAELRPIPKYGDMLKQQLLDATLAVSMSAAPIIHGHGYKETVERTTGISRKSRSRRRIAVEILN